MLSYVVKDDNPIKFIRLNRIPVADIFQTRKRRQVLHDDHDDDHDDDLDGDNDGDHEKEEESRRANIDRCCKHTVQHI